MQMAAEAWPIGRIGILGQTKECLLERGPLSVRSCNCTKFVSHLVLVDCETFDGCEVTRAHHMEVLPTRSERSSMTLEIRDLVWLAFLAREVVERRWQNR